MPADFQPAANPGKSAWNDEDLPQLVADDGHDKSNKQKTRRKNTGSNRDSSSSSKKSQSSKRSKTPQLPVPQPSYDPYFGDTPV